MSDPLTLDDRLARLSRDIDPELWDEFAALRRTLRDAANPHGTLLHTSRLALRVFRKAYRDAGHALPNDNLFSVIVTACEWKNPEKKERGLGLLPDPVASAAHTVRVYSNKVDHDAEGGGWFGWEAVDTAVNALLTLLKWYYCEYAACPTRLASLYTPVPAPAPAAGSSIPYFDTPFFGRAADLAWLGEQLDPKTGTGVVTLTGTGGIGKTRLACEAARARIPDYPGGCHLVELKDLQTPTDIAAAVAEVLGSPLRDGSRDAAWVLGQMLRTRPTTLLVLDNFEHLAKYAAHTVRVWRGAAPAVRVLATSRVPLGLDGEVTRTIQPLPMPDPIPDAVVLTADQLAAVFENDAVRLFCEAARGRGPGLIPDETTARAVVKVCRRLDGQPLPITLVARRTDEFDLPALADEVRANCIATAQSGGRTLADAIQWSYRLLEQHEQDGFRRLAVFREGFTREAAVHVLRGVHAPAGITTDAILLRLREYSLVEMTWRGGRVRYKMFQTLQDFARERWDTPNVLPSDLGAAWVGHFQSLTDVHRPRIGTADGRAALDLLSEERENVVAAAEWAGANGHPADAARLLLGFADVLTLRGPWQIRAELFRVAADRLAATAPPLAAALRCEQASAVWAESDYKQALAVAEQALGLARAAGRPELLARALREAAFSARQAGAADAAHQYSQEGIAAAEAAGLLDLVADCRSNLALLRDRAGDYPVAVAAADRAVTEAEQSKDARLLARVVNSQGLVWWHAGEPGRALECFERAHQLFGACDDPRWQAGAMTNRGLALVDVGRLADAAAQFADAGPRHLAQGNVSWWAVNQGGLGLVAVLEGRPADAAAVLTAARARALETKYSENQAMIDGLLGRAALAGEDWGDAERHFDRAIEYEMRNQARDRRHAGNLINRAAARLALGHRDDARSDLAVGLTVAAALGMAVTSSIRLDREDMDLARRLMEVLG